MCAKIPEKKWQTERESLLMDRYSLVDEYIKSATTLRVLRQCDAVLKVL